MGEDPGAPPNADIDGYQGDIDGYQGDIDRYRAADEGRSSIPEDPTNVRPSEPDMPDPARDACEDVRPYLSARGELRVEWTEMASKYGAEYADMCTRGRLQLEGEIPWEADPQMPLHEQPRLKRQALVESRDGDALPTPHVDRTSLRREPIDHQVGLRLTRTDFARLGTAARSCGLARSSLARLLVVRGVDGILSEINRDG